MQQEHGEIELAMCKSSSSLLCPVEVLGHPQQVTGGAAVASLQDPRMQISLAFPPKE